MVVFGVEKGRKVFIKNLCVGGRLLRKQVEAAREKQPFHTRPQFTITSLNKPQLPLKQHPTAINPLRAVNNIRRKRDNVVNDDRAKRDHGDFVYSEKAAGQVSLHN